MLQPPSSFTSMLAYVRGSCYCPAAAEQRAGWPKKKYSACPPSCFPGCMTAVQRVANTALNGRQLHTHPWVIGRHHPGLQRKPAPSRSFLLQRNRYLTHRTASGSQGGSVGRLMKPGRGRREHLKCVGFVACVAGPRTGARQRHAATKRSIRPSRLPRRNEKPVALLAGPVYPWVERRGMCAIASAARYAAPRPTLQSHRILDTQGGIQAEKLPSHCRGWLLAIDYTSGAPSLRLHAVMATVSFLSQALDDARVPSHTDCCHKRGGQFWQEAPRQCIPRRGWTRGGPTSA